MGVERVVGSMFSGCSSLTDITFGSGVTSIGDRAFAYCTSLESITIPDHITYIEESAFVNCSALETIDLGNGVTDIGARAFTNCTALTSVTLPDNVVNLYTGAFSNCTKLESVKIGNGIFVIYAGTFDNCTSLSDVKIGSGVKTIEYYAFLNCSNMKNLVLPDTVTYIDDYAFDYDPVESTPANVTVWYLGTEEQKNNISIGYCNNNLTNATWHYNVTMTQDGDKQTYTCGDCGETYEFTIAEVPEAELPKVQIEFKDISSTSWQYTAAKYAVEKNLMAGKGTDAEGRIKFDPNNYITREEFVQVLYNAEGKPSVEGVVNRFPDVKNEWYKNAVLWANSMNIASGMGNGNFGVGKNITRQDLAVMLYKYAAMKTFSLSANAGEIDQYADGNMVSDYAKTAMNWAVTNGIMSGKGTAGEPISTFRLDPTGTATRAECAAMLKNFMENVWVDEKQ